MKSWTEKEILEYLEQNLIIVADASKLTDEEYSLVRKDSLGASDSSIVLDVNLYKNKDQLITEKKSKFLTDEEKEVGKKPAVRKGKDLESLILSKFVKATGLPLIKPPYMYRHKEFSYFTTNFDGVAIEDTIIPVEAKLVTKYGEKYYRKHMPLDKTIKPVHNPSHTTVEHIKYWADKCGIPAYYYTQIQQQILFLDSEGYTTPYGYLPCIFDDSWDFEYFYVPRDEYTISHLISDGAKLWEKVEQACK